MNEIQFERLMNCIRSMGFLICYAIFNCAGNHLASVIFLVCFFFAAIFAIGRIEKN